ncbi:MAG: nitrous oxide reductase family maturation protein NosD [Candidatus Thorarchaeota archaeon]
MRRIAAILFCLTLLVVCPLTATWCYFDSHSSRQSRDVSRGFVPAYDEAPPIHISNDSDFADQASANSWDGNGSVSDPYIVKGLNITTAGTSPIQIGNSTVFFEVRGCLLVGGAMGILLDNVTNAKVWNNTIQDSQSSGILVTESDDVIVTNNTIQDISGPDSAGLYSLGSEYCEYSNNTIDSVNGWGILADYTNNCSISDNVVSDLLHDGIRLRDSSENNITLNTVTSGMSGIKLGNSPRCRLERNLVGFSLSDGISIEASATCVIKDNVVHESGSYSLDLSGDSSDIISNTFHRSQMQGLRIQSDNNYVTQNNLIENNLGFVEAATYLDISGSNNDVIGNYYDAWTWPDDDENDIVDHAYPFGVGQSDSEPYIRVFLTDLMHILTKPRLIYPNETLDGERFWGQIQIAWSVSSDTFGHDVIYNVSASADGGSSWIELVHGLIDTNLNWNSSDFLESTECRIRIAAQCTDGLISEYTTNAMYEVKSHTLSAPTVLTPNGGETIGGDYEITWTDSVESWGLIVSYDVFYSTDAGETWNVIISTYDSTSIAWDARGLPETDQYLIRVIARGASGLTAEDVSDSVFSVRWSSNTIVIGLVGGGAILIVVAVYALRRRGTI